MSERRLAQKINEFSTNGKVVRLWLMPNQTNQIIISQKETNGILKIISAKRDNLHDDEIPLKFQELEAEEIGTKIDEFVADGDGKVTKLWLMPDQNLKIIVSDKDTNGVAKVIDSKAAKLDQAEMVLRFEELRAEMLKDTARLDKYRQYAFELNEKE